jgi:DNA-binding LacI/PurR family transcriptional regulator
MTAKLVHRQRPKVRASATRWAIAEELEVSIDTVNAYFSLSRRAGVAAKTRERIAGAAENLGYRPKARTTGQIARQHLTIGYQVPRTWDTGRIDNVVFARFFAALQQETERLGMQLRTFGGGPVDDDTRIDPTIGRQQSDRQLVAHLEDLYRTRQVDAFVFDDPADRDARIQHARHTGIPYVVTGDPVTFDQASKTLRRPAWADTWPCVDFDDELGFHDLTTVAIVARRHRTLMHVGFADDGTYPGPRRAMGVARAAIEHRVAPPVRVSLHYNAAPRDAIAQIREALIQHPDVTAVVCDCDRYAFHTRLAAQSLIDIPTMTDLMVVGCDDDPVQRLTNRHTDRTPTRRITPRIVGLLDSDCAAVAKLACVTAAE